MKYEIVLRGSNGSDSVLYLPVIKDNIEWETERKGSPSKLTFTVIKDENIAFEEGAPVILKADGKGIFYGFVFEKERDKDHHIKCTCYDQLRYFKNKTTLLYENKSASDLVKMLANDFKLVTGTIESTGHVIKQRDEDNQTIFDIVLNALDETLLNTGKMYVLYDDFGKITLKNIESMKTKFVIDYETAENFSYTSSIDRDTFNQVMVVVESEKDKTTGKKKRTKYVDYDPKTQKWWGKLQTVEKVEEGVNVANFAKMVLKAKNRKTRQLTIKNCIGDFSIRAGCSVHVHINIGDIVVAQALVCEKVTHYITADHHSMDITVWDANTFTGD